jgi:predicted nucleic acid-binding protein
MDRAVSNATPLIDLARARQLEILHALIKELLIPEAVHREVVINGKRLNERDAYRIEDSIEKGRIIVHRVKQVYPVKLNIHPGEEEVISLAKEKGIQFVLMDDVKARVASELAGLRPLGTVWLLLKALKESILNFDGFLSSLEHMIDSGFYLKENVYIRVVREARAIAWRKENPNHG